MKVRQKRVIKSIALYWAFLLTPYFILHVGEKYIFSLKFTAFLENVAGINTLLSIPITFVFSRWYLKNTTKEYLISLGIFLASVLAFLYFMLMNTSWI